jgi:hypothetical protein
MSYLSILSTEASHKKTKTALPIGKPVLRVDMLAGRDQSVRVASCLRHELQRGAGGLVAERVEYPPVVVVHVAGDDDVPRVL